MNEEQSDLKLRIVRLLDPSICTSCRMAAIATVAMADGSSRRMLHCKRLDCDNWQTDTTGDDPVHLSDVVDGTEQL